MNGGEPVEVHSEKRQRGATANDANRLIQG